MRRLILVLSCLLWASLAVAQDQPAPQDEAQEKAQQTAKAHFDKGSELFTKKEYLRAGKEFDLANQAYADPFFLYNAGVCYMNAGLDEQAYGLFREYLGKYPDAPNRDEVEKYVGQLALANPGLITKYIQSKNNPNPTIILPLYYANPSADNPNRLVLFCTQRKVACGVVGGLILGAAGFSAYHEATVRNIPDTTLGTQTLK